MKKFAILFIVLGLCMANIGAIKQPVPMEGYVTAEHQIKAVSGRSAIASVGDLRTILGPSGKNIAVCDCGAAIAVIYGSPSDPYDPNNPFGGIGAGYSTDFGANWGTYGPFNSLSPIRRIYPGIDGCANFCTQAGNIFFVWHEGPLGYATNDGFTMIEENIPSAPSFSSPVLIPNNMFPWMPCIGVNPDNNLHVMVTAWSYLSGGNQNLYAWISTDGGYAWSDTIRVATALGANIGAGHFRFGSGNYVFHTYHDTYTGVEYPYYNESTDGGYTWSAPAVLPALTSLSFWWHEFDVEVCADRPFVEHNDTDPTGSTQLFYPDPISPGGIGSWNWTALSVDPIGNTDIVIADTTFHCEVGRYTSGASVCYNPELDVVLCSYRGYYVISTAAGDTLFNGNAFGGIVSLDKGVTWRVTRPLSGVLTNPQATEMAHRLVTNWTSGIFNIASDTIWAFSTWTDADNGVAGNQYFELGVVLPVDVVDWVPGVAENGNTEPVTTSKLTVYPNISRGVCHATFALPQAGEVDIRVFDITGRQVSTIYSGHLDQGEHTINMNTANLANGIYIVRLVSNATNLTSKFIMTH